VLVPTLRLFAASHAPNSTFIAIDGKPLADPSPCTAPPQEHFARITQAAEDLAAIQDHLQDVFPVPALNPQLAHLLARLRRLLDGEQVAWMRGTMTMYLDAARVPEFLADIGTVNRFAFAAEAPSVLVYIGDVPVEVGPIRYYAAEAEIDSITLLRRVRPTDADPTVAIRPLGDGYFYIQLLDRLPTGGKAIYRAAPGTPLPETAQPTDGPDEPFAD
jgi:hypothetical protein